MTIDSSSTISLAVEGADLLRRGRQRDRAVGVVAPRQPALGDQGADTGRGEERADAGAAGAQPLGERALRGELDGQLAGEVLPGELLVLPDVGRDDAADPPRLQQQPSPAPSTPQLLDTTVRSSAPCSSSASMRNHGMPARPKPPTARLAPDGDVGDGVGGAADDLVGS